MKKLTNLLQWRQFGAFLSNFLQTIADNFWII